MDTVIAAIIAITVVALITAYYMHKSEKRQREADKRANLLAMNREHEAYNKRIVRHLSLSPSNGAQQAGAVSDIALAAKLKG